MRLRLVLTLLTAGVVACENRNGESTEALPWAAAADTQWVNIDGVEFPAETKRADPEIIEAYVFAAKHPEVLHYMPCYCGCESGFNHESNYDCFINGIDDSGAVPRVSPDVIFGFVLNTRNTLHHKISQDSANSV